MRKALLLSTTTAPEAAAAGPNSRLREAPAEKRAICTPLKESLVSFSTLTGFAVELQLFAYRAFRGQKFDGADRKFPLLQGFDHFQPDGSGGAGNGHSVRLPFHPRISLERNLIFGNLN